MDYFMIEIGMHRVAHTLVSFGLSRDYTHCRFDSSLIFNLDLIVSFEPT